ncbi:hypothetical protein MYCTH_2300199 [Thermothelomyces thermophilus ATCC 42464]|uniref:Peptide N-acetyl-beta-D-glucosaminyl asparaginase amidase A N-terminal domain-containing protein n=1 Tax=Thermothelomyces thermophilus (strain ATCC 42464 / BCRC 31852 / DSM 1799) TaxID=573729 RepID=G2QAQ9_THET4|nr:uncharacterized protein MYCTH_2300199 [Thermothelomyces thermophilus ATCC 42464]AEO55901.1 hypothetical protein MYCTH_2300199 [Thermothelomyces thermophilus ATCC 42464]
MASFDLEKRAIASAEGNYVSQTFKENTPRRRGFHWLALLLGTLSIFSIAVAASRRCSAATSLFSSYGASRTSRSHSAPGSQPGYNRLPGRKAWEATTATTSSATPHPTVLKTFEVAQPVLMPDGPAESDGSTRNATDYSPELCTVLLMRHDFAWSYDAPFMGEYTPPDCEFNRVVLNFSVVSEGRQFDRLAIMYFGDTEVWRTSTAEPTAPPGISWTYLKDMTQYLYFWKSPQKIIFDLGNLIDDKYTGIFNTTLTAIFYNRDIKTDQAPPSDLIIPISAHRGANNSISRFILPTENATNTITLPRNIRRAVFSVSANGQASEEFWWSNVLQTDVDTFSATAGELPGLSPFREVQVLIDGRLAGVQWPFPVIFTGGVVPSLHRPIVGIHAFDLREHEIDISPFLGLLCDGKEHTFTIRVAGLNNTSHTAATLTNTVNESWYVTGKLFLWLDSDPSSITRGEIPIIMQPAPAISTTRSVTSSLINGTTEANETLTYTTSVRRSLRITSNTASWTQSLTYTNKGHVSAFGYTQFNNLLISGSDTLRIASPSVRYHATYRYPILCNSTYSVSPQGNLSISAYLSHGKSVSVSGASVFPTGLEAFQRYAGKGSTSRVETTKVGTAEFRQTGDGRSSTGWGEAKQWFWFGLEEAVVEDGGSGTGANPGTGGDVESPEDRRGKELELYYREVEAVNGTVVGDLRRLDGKAVSSGSGGDGEGQQKVLVNAAAMQYA